MARREIVIMTDDIGGDDDESVATVQFALDGRAYEIDLTKSRQDLLRAVLAPYIDAGRRVGQAGRVPRQRSGPDPVKVRAWAREHGHHVTRRGRISAELLAAYEAAGGR